MRGTRFLLGVVGCAAMTFLLGCPDDVKQGSPKEVLESLHKISTDKNYDAMPDLVHPDYKKAVKIMAEAMEEHDVKQSKLAKLIKAEIGEEEAKRYEDRDRSPLQKALKDDGSIDWDKIKITEDGDTATYEIDGKKADEVLKKVDGKWYVLLDDDKDMTPEKAEKQATEMKEHMEKTVAAYDEIIAGIKDGQIKKENFATEVGKIMQKVWE